MVRPRRSPPPRKPWSTSCLRATICEVLRPGISRPLSATIFSSAPVARALNIPALCEPCPTSSWPAASGATIRARSRRGCTRPPAPPRRSSRAPRQRRRAPGRGSGVHRSARGRLSGATAAGAGVGAPPAPAGAVSGRAGGAGRCARRGRRGGAGRAGAQQRQGDESGTETPRRVHYRALLTGGPPHATVAPSSRGGEVEGNGRRRSAERHQS